MTTRLESTVEESWKSHHHPNLMRLAAGAALLWFVAGCAPINPRTDLSTVAPPKMTVAQARTTINELLQTITPGADKEPYQNVVMRPDGFQFLKKFWVQDVFPLFGAPKHLKSSTVNIVYKDARKCRVGSDHVSVAIGQEYIGPWGTRLQAQRFVDAFSAMVLASSGQGYVDRTQEFLDFRESARAWRALSTKPALPADAYKHKVLAENSYREKNFDDAIEHYRAALEISSLWPDGQFNLAVLYGERESYADALFHGRCSLEMGLNARDEQFMRDKIIIWEDKLRKTTAR